MILLPRRYDDDAARPSDRDVLAHLGLPTPHALLLQARLLLYVRVLVEAPWAALRGRRRDRASTTLRTPQPMEAAARLAADASTAARKRPRGAS